jgi:hypothetical protein
MIGGLAIRSKDDEVLDVRVVELDRASHQVAERGPARRDLEADGARRPGRFTRGDFVNAKRAAGPVVHPAAAGCLGRLALLLQCVGAAVTVVRAPVRDQALGHRAIGLDAL